MIRCVWAGRLCAPPLNAVRLCGTRHEALAHLSLFNVCPTDPAEFESCCAVQMHVVRSAHLQTALAVIQDVTVALTITQWITFATDIPGIASVVHIIHHAMGVVSDVAVVFIAVAVPLGFQIMTMLEPAAEGYTIVEATLQAMSGRGLHSEFFLRRPCQLLLASGTWHPAHRCTRHPVAGGLKAGTVELHALRRARHHTPTWLRQ